MTARRPGEGAACVCGSGRAFGSCCAPALDGHPPDTARGLMRSRYTAFALGDADYLTQTWHPGTRPPQIEIDPDLRWRGLAIVRSTAGGAEDRRGTVEFRATWQEGAASGVLHERSRFVRQSGRWWYLDGVIDPTPDVGA